MKLSHQKYFSCLLVVLLMSGCGFHLRNQNTLPPTLLSLEVISEKPYENFTKQLKRELVLLTNPSSNAKSTAQIIIHKHKLSYRMPIIGSSQQARIYRYTFLLEYSLKINNKLVLKNKKITLSKLLTLNQNALLTTNNQQELLTLEIQHEAIEQLINELKSPRIQSRYHDGLSLEELPDETDSESPMLPYDDISTSE
jgi:LPS-assembly lipoprotein